MAFEKIKNSDLNGKGVMGLPDTPGLTASEMQRKFDEIAKEVIVPKYNELVEQLNDDGVANSSQILDPVDGTKKSIQLALNDVKDYASYIGDKAEEYADSKDAENLETAKDYTNDETLKIAFAAKEYTDRVATETLQTANDYTDAQVERFKDIEKVAKTLENSDNSIPTSKAVLDAMSDLGAGDMLKAVYDTNGNGIVDNSERLGGKLPSDYAEKEALKTVAFTGKYTDLNFEGAEISTGIDLESYEAYEQGIKDGTITEDDNKDYYIPNEETELLPNAYQIEYKGSTVGDTLDSQSEEIAKHWVSSKITDVTSIFTNQGAKYTVPQDGVIHFEMYADTADTSWRITSNNGLRYWIHEDTIYSVATHEFSVYKGEVLDVALVYNVNATQSKVFFRPIG